MRSLSSLVAELKEVKEELNTHGQHVSPLQLRILRRRHARLSRMVKEASSFQTQAEYIKGQLRLSV